MHAWFTRAKHKLILPWQCMGFWLFKCLVPFWLRCYCCFVLYFYIVISKIHYYYYYYFIGQYLFIISHILNFSIALHPFLHLTVSLDLFFSVWKLAFVISFSMDVLVAKKSQILFHNILILPSFLKENFSSQKILI